MRQIVKNWGTYTNPLIFHAMVRTTGELGFNRDLIAINREKP
jgi:hypothetical protein